MGDDRKTLQGLWRVVSMVKRGSEVYSSNTHYLFDGDRVKAITPSLVDGGRWSTFDLDPTSDPKRFTMISEIEGRDGPFQRVDRWLYEVTGDQLRLCWPSVFGKYPDLVSDTDHAVITLARDHGPLPQTKQASNRATIEDPVLGLIVWDDDLNYWKAKAALDAGSSFDVTISTDEATDPFSNEAAIAMAARDLVDWLRDNDIAARRFAASHLLQLHNDTWNQGRPITADEFTERMQLQSANLDSGGVELFYDDGDLFWGHSISISLGSERDFIDATIAG
jgi:uncharacterized protein (TIGR03067 family)